MHGISFHIFILSVCLVVNDVIGKSHGHHSKSRNDSKIVGGQETTINEYPYQVYLLILKGGSYYACGGSILSSRYLLTAAHCMIGAQRVYIRAGSTDSDSGGTMYSSSLYTVHPQYNSRTYDYDIAVIRLLRSIRLDGLTTRAVQLPESNSTVEAGRNVVVTGWGATSEGGDSSSTLMTVTVPVTTREYCNRAYSNGITQRMFCAGEEEGGKDACQGDSGGPVVDEETFVQKGVVSWGVGCARPRFPGVYTNVPYFRDWIRITTGV